METLTIFGLLSLGIIAGLVIDHVWQKRKWNERIRRDKEIADRRRDVAYFTSKVSEPDNLFVPERKK